MGFETRARVDWQNYMVPPVATRSKKPESVAKEIAEKTQKREAQAHLWPVTATVTEVVILGPAGEKLFQATEHITSPYPDGNCSHVAMAWLADWQRGQPGVIKGPEDAGGFKIYGLGIRQNLRIMAIDAIAVGATPPPELWLHPPFSETLWCDPYDMVIPSDRRADIPVEKLLRFWDPAVADVPLALGALGRAQQAQRLATKIGLL